MTDPEAAAPGLHERILGALPASVLVLDAVGTITFATERAAALVGRTVDEFVGESVLQFVTEDFAWAYAASVAMASDYAGVTMGPLRIAFKGPNGEILHADLWADSHLDDPAIAGIVCLITEESSAVAMGDAVEAFAQGAAFEDIVRFVIHAMRGAPVVADAQLVEVGDHACTVRATSDAPEALIADDGPWRTAIDTELRQLHPDLSELPPAVAEAAAAAGYAAVWVEPVQLAGVTSPLALVLWRRRPNNPSPNQLTSFHQGASIIAAAWSRLPSSH